MEQSKIILKPFIYFNPPSPENYIMLFIDANPNTTSCEGSNSYIAIIFWFIKIKIAEANKIAVPITIETIYIKLCRLGY